MKALKIILLILLLIIGGFLIWQSTLNGAYDMKRSIFIASSPEAVYSEVADFKNWPEWGPWFAKDSTLTPVFGEKTTGIGGKYSWTSENSGNGSMEFVVCEPYTALSALITFEGMGQGHDYWTFEAQEGGTLVTWGFKGEMPFLFRFMALGIEKAVGPDYEAGLANLKYVLENRTPGFDVAEKFLSPADAYFMSYDVSWGDMSDEWFEAGYQKIMNYLGSDTAYMTGSPMAVYHVWDTVNKRTEMDLMIPCYSAKTGNKEVKKGTTMEGKTLFTTLYGRYDNLNLAHEAIMKYMREKNIEQDGPAMEVYVTDPVNTPDTAQWVTEIYYKVK